jgi:hypothetical protein
MVFSFGWGPVWAQVSPGISSAPSRGERRRVGLMEIMDGKGWLT